MASDNTTPWPDFCGPSYVARSALALYARSVNLYPSRIEIDNPKAQFVLYGTPGTSLLLNATDGPGRALWPISSGDRCFAMLGRTLGEVNPIALTFTARQTLVADGNPAQLVDNGDGGGQLAICTGGNYYAYNLAANTISGVLKTPISHIGMLDGYILLLDSTTSTLWQTNLFDAATIDGTNFAQRSTAPDRWKAMLVRDADVFLIGDKTGDVYYNRGTSTFAFGPRSGIRIRTGIGAPFSIADCELGPVWLSKDEKGQGVVVQVQSGYRAVAVSPQGMNALISTYSRIDDAIGWTHQLDGQEFYVLTFPTAGKTWVWDPSLGMFGWHERLYFNPTTAQYEAYRPHFHAMYKGLHVVLDRDGPGIYNLSPEVYTDVGGAALRRMRVVPGPETRQRDLSLARVGLHIDQGVGASSGQGSNPQVAMRSSGNAGHTWSAERLRTFGALGVYNGRTEWSCVGGARYRDPLLEYVISDPVPVRIVGAYFEADLSTS